IASSIYSINYLQEYLGKGGWKISVLFNLFAAAMTALVVAANVMVFMFFVEIISLASVLLVVSGGSEANRKAGLQYFVVDHLANLFILVAFLILVCHSHSFDFSIFVATPITGATASWA
ncbi:proton-conducting transporter transmembrane domain-containing protein, partial [Poseidonibacter lekithochrous]